MLTAPRLTPARALPLLRAAVEANPGHAESRLRLARALFADDRLAELTGWLTPDEEGPELLHLLGVAASVLGDDGLALTVLERAAEAGHDASLGYLAEVLLRAPGRGDEAGRVAQYGLDRSPRDFKSQSVLANLLLARGERGRLWELCAELRARGAEGGYVPSAMAHAAESPGERAAVAALVGEWPVARSLDGVACERVRDELLAHPRLRELPATRSTTGSGARVDRLEDAPGPAIAELLEQIEAAVRAQASAPFDLHAWAVATRADGHEGWHIHPAASLSGVYYVAVPEAGGDARAGAIEFGPMPLGSDAEPPAWPRRRVRPRAGQLLLFPSFYGHRTWPTGSDETRLVVAFDALPAEAPR